MSRDYAKCIILPLASAANGYDELITACKKTWAAIEQRGILIRFMWGMESGSTSTGSVIERVQDKDIICDWPETPDMLQCKTVSSFAHVLQRYEFEYIFRCCSGSYVAQGPLLALLEGKPDKQFYCGINTEHQGIAYASGSGYFLSRDLVASVLYQAENLRDGNIDDVEIGHLMAQMGVKNDPAAKRVDCKSESDLGYVPDAYHYHFRKQPKWMYKIHENIFKANNESQ